MNRSRLFAAIEHVERVNERALEPPPPRQPRPTSSPPPTPRSRAEELFRPRHTLTASPTALATAAKAQISAKSLKKALALITEHGADKVAVILQGKLAAGDVVAEAGLVARVRAPKPAR